MRFGWVPGLNGNRSLLIILYNWFNFRFDRGEVSRDFDGELVMRKLRTL